MSVIDRLKRLSGETKPELKQSVRQDEIGELRQRIESIMARRPDPTIRTTYPNKFAGKPVELNDLIPGEELDNAFGRFYVAPGCSVGSSFHGARCIRDYASVDMEAAALIANEPALADFDLADGLFLDTETTGLMGGTGTLAFLVGLGWFEGDTFITRQIFARDFAEEQACLIFLQDIVKNKKFLITFNGKAFDVGLLSTRFVMNRLPNPLADLPHLDLLHPSRRLYGHRLMNHRLISLEEAIIGFSRQDDLPGSEIPQRYFDWLRRRDARLMADVFEHNRLDIISMAALSAHLTELMSHPADLNVCHHADLLCAARLYHDRGRIPDAQKRLLPLTASDDQHVKADSFKMLSLIHKRAGQWDEAVRIWELMIEHDFGDVFAKIELAKWYEHRLHDFQHAKYLVIKALDIVNNEEEQNSLMHRFKRLERYDKD
ncbi:MAG: ribonuclease H-like domain-containing protein [Deltaproteobacteria bacterium]|nr:ribonuclease H-like domain-containing protein [Deltaproteobacteria bacterium]